MKKMIMVDPDDFFMTSRRDNRGSVPFNELKTYKKFKKFLKQEEEEAKKNKKEDPPKKGWLDKMSVAEKTIFFAVFGPPLGVGYVFGLLILCRALAEMAGVK